MKKFLCLMLSLVMLLSISAVVGLTASAETSGDFEYSVLEDGTASIYKYSGSATELVIPSAFDGYTVTEIKNEAFEYCTSLIEVTVPDSVATIENYAFSDCINLVKANIGSGVTSMGSEANNVFYGCSNLQEINVDENNTFYSSLDGVLFNEDKTELLVYPVGNKQATYNVPESVTIIGDYAFSGCTALTNVNIGSRVTSIEDWAFLSCTALTNVTMRNSLKSIGSNVFENCSALTEIVIPVGVTEIGTGCFNFCTNLEKIALPDSLTKMWQPLFLQCTSLKNISVSENNTKYSSQDGVLFNKDKTELIQYPAGSEKNLYTIPDSVTNIASHAFNYCSSLQEITIPDSVTNIDQWAFEECNSLKNIIIPETVKYIGVGLLYGCDALERVVILNPNCNIDAYREGGQDTFPLNAVIYGYLGSTTQEYVEYYSDSETTFNFMPIIEEDTDTEYIKNSSDGAKIHCSFELNDFVSTEIDGAEVDPSNYTLSEGSTIITFEPAYLDTLTVGEHTITLNFTDANATSTLNIVSSSDEAVTDADEPTTTAEKPAADSGSHTTESTATDKIDKSDIVADTSEISNSGVSSKSPHTGASYAGVAAIGAAIISTAVLVMFKKKKQ